MQKGQEAAKCAYKREILADIVHWACLRHFQISLCFFERTNFFIYIFTGLIGFALIPFCSIHPECGSGTDRQVQILSLDSCIKQNLDKIAWLGKVFPTIAACPLCDQVEEIEDHRWSHVFSWDKSGSMSCKHTTYNWSKKKHTTYKSWLYRMTSPFLIGDGR